MGRGGGGQIIKQSAGQVWLDLTPLCVFLIGSRECSRQQAECRELETFLQVLYFYDYKQHHCKPDNTLLGWPE